VSFSGLASAILFLCCLRLLC